MSASYRLAASGSPAAELPAYELQPPVDTLLAGWLPQMADWRWERPPAAEVTRGELVDVEIELRVVERRGATTAVSRR
jgi:hypothetical protein